MSRAKIDQAGTLDDLLSSIKSPKGVMLRVKDVVRLCKVSERTVRRYIREGILLPVTIDGVRGKEHEFPLDHVAEVFGSRSSIIERGKVSPVQDLTRSIELLSAEIQAERERLRAELTATAEAERAAQQELLDRLKAQSELIDQLKHEQRDARAQIHQLQEQILKALPAPKPKGWRGLFSGRSKS